MKPTGEMILWFPAVISPIVGFARKDIHMKRELSSIEKRIYEIGILPVVTIENAKDAVPMANALIEGGLPCAEVTFRTEAAAEAIRQIRENCPDVLCGAGTVLTIEQLQQAAEAGAQFVVSPGLQPKIVEAALRMGMPIFPGCATPSDVETAMALGLQTVKFFPAEAAGGVAMLKAMAVPYCMLRFIPTGGIDTKNLASYTGLKCVLACGGSFIVKKDWLANGEYAKITAAAREAIAAMLQLRMGHVGVIAKDIDDCRKTADTFSKLLVAEKSGNDTGDAFMVGDYFEVLCKNTNGERGHVCIRTIDVPRAAAYFKRMGVEFLPETAQYEKDGTLRLIYCKETWCGMGLHLLPSTK